MDQRRKLDQALSKIQKEMKELEIHYEQYFAGVEKREPQRNRHDLARTIRHFTNRPIFQTDIKFRYESLASRFYSYSQYWDRILRLMDEGKYHRHLNHKSMAPKPAALPPAQSEAIQQPPNEAERLLIALNEAHKKCGQSGPSPTLKKVAHFLAVQEQKIREKFGDRSVEFMVDSSSGKPQIKVRLKKG